MALPKPLPGSSHLVYTSNLYRLQSLGAPVEDLFSPPVWYCPHRRWLHTSLTCNANEEPAPFTAETLREYAMLVAVTLCNRCTESHLLDYVPRTVWAHAHHAADSIERAQGSLATTTKATPYEAFHMAERGLIATLASRRSLHPKGNVAPETPVSALAWLDEIRPALIDKAEAIRAQLLRKFRSGPKGEQRNLVLVPNVRKTQFTWLDATDAKHRRQVIRTLATARPLALANDDGTESWMLVAIGEFTTEPDWWTWGRRWHHVRTLGPMLDTDTQDVWDALRMITKANPTMPGDVALAAARAVTD